MKTNAPVEPDNPVTRPSFAQIMAGVLTAVTSTLALSYLGVAGTILGAAVASVLTVLANYWYTRSIVRTTQTVSALAPRVIGHSRSSSEPGAADTAALPAARPGDTAALPVTGEASPDAQPGEPEADTATDAQVPDGADDESDSADDRADSADDRTDEQPAERDHHALMRGTRAGRRRFILPTLVVFVIVLAVVTLIELGIGRPISDALRGQEGSGTTVFPSRVEQSPQPTDDPAEEPSPTDSPSDTPSPTDTPTPTETTPEPTNSPEPTSPSPTSPSPTSTETPVPTPEPTTPEPAGDSTGDTTRDTALDAQEPVPTGPTGPTG